MVDRGTATVQVCYPSHEDQDFLHEDLRELFDSYSRRLAPSRILFVCPLGMETNISQCYKQLEKEIEGRLVTVSHIAIAPYDHRGKLATKNSISLKPSESSWDFDDGWLTDVSERIVRELLERTNTILQAPHGYVFRKPSRNEERIFVRAGNMLRNPSCLTVFNHLLLRRLPQQCRCIYIDSATILSFALSLRSIVRYFRTTVDELRTLSIENFHSYDIKRSAFRIPNDNNYMVLISASTSGGLANKLITDFLVSKERIFHLLGVGSEELEFKDSCVCYQVRELESQRPASRSSSNTPIEIPTEEFLTAQGTTIRVPITKGHVSKIGARELHRAVYRRTLGFGRPIGPNPKAFSSFSISNRVEHAKDSRIREWISQLLIHDLPASAHSIVHADDPMSKRVASWIGRALGRGLKIMNLHELESTKSDESFENGSLVLVAHQDPGLEWFGRTNIELRKLGNPHRHFVLCFYFPESSNKHLRHRRDLCLAPDNRNFGWSDFLVLPVGEEKLHEPLIQHRSPYTKEAVENRREILGEDLASALLARKKCSAINAESLFFPSTSGESLQLRHGSIFFPDSSPVSVSQIAVYALVSTAVQDAREDSEQGSIQTTGRPRFDGNPFVRSVLDPDMFNRYSDGILQAALLRTTRKAELDYSADEVLSKEFSSICRSVFANHKNSVGDAAIEFLYAFDSNKVSLRDPDKELLVKTIQEHPRIQAVWEVLQTAKQESPETEFEG